MPLSEDDQRIFSQIERSFYESDPEFAHRVATSPGVVSHATRNMKLSGVGFVVGLGLLIGLFTVSPLLGFIGFAVMVGSALVFVDNARKAGKIGLQNLNEAVKARQETMGSARQRMRDRFRDE